MNITRIQNFTSLTLISNRKIIFCINIAGLKFSLRPFFFHSLIFIRWILISMVLKIDF